VNLAGFVCSARSVQQPSLLMDHGNTHAPELRCRQARAREWRWAGRAAASCVAVLGLAAASTARADGVTPEAMQKLIELDQRAHILALEFNEALVASLDERVIDAQMLQGLGDHTAAVTILLDVIAKRPGPRTLQDALFLLGESFFELRNYQSSRRYFESSIEPFVPTKRAQQTLLRLIQIALLTADFGHAEGYFAKLAEVPAASLEPSLPYAKGKYRYFRDRNDEAKTIFAAIAPSSPYYFQARYFLATIALKTGDLDEALLLYEAILGLQPPDATAGEIQDLARLALGRILHKRGRFERAADFYGLVAPQSQHYPQALFELGWTHIEAKELLSAYLAFDALLRTAPDWPDAPELRVLLGNLELQLGHLRPAGDFFARTREEFEPIYEQTRTAVGPTLDELEATRRIDSRVAKWLRADPEMARMLAVARDVADIRQALGDTTKTLARLDALVVRKDKVGLFSDLARARERSRELLLGLTAIREPFVSTEARVTDARVEANSPPSFKRNASLGRSETVSLRAPIPHTIVWPSAKAPAPLEGGVAALLSRASAVESQLVAFDERIEREAGERLKILNDQIAAERKRSEVAKGSLLALLGESQSLHDGLLAQALARATTRLYELVVRADAGLIDVSWGRKAERSSAIGKLVAEQKRELDAADAELEQFLENP
jgi:tetratricopeptide (TPR) repeat protein